MGEYTPSAIRELESVDDTLRGLCASIEIMTVGVEEMANGEFIADMLNLIKKNLQNARAELDDATSAVVRVCATA